jgi:hypothetical protein
MQREDPGAPVGGGGERIEAHRPREVEHPLSGMEGVVGRQLGAEGPDGVVGNAQHHH